MWQKFVSQRVAPRVKYTSRVVLTAAISLGAIERAGAAATAEVAVQR